MPSYDEVRHVPFSPRLMFDLVADVGSYPEFLPWCVGARLRDRQPHTFLADLVIGFGLLREKYTSRVNLDMDTHTIRIDYLNGPFKHLDNHWQFNAAEDGGTNIVFHINFEFQSALLQKVIGTMFGEAVTIMVNAFERRARDLYAEE